MTPAELEEHLEYDFAWRREEINVASRLVQSQISGSIAQKVLLRSFVPLAYAHWEGFVRYAAQEYLYFVRENASSFADLKENFLWIMARNETRKLYGSLKPIVEHNQIVRNIIDSYSAIDRNLFDDAISTESNLSEKVFEKICVIIGLSHRKSNSDYVFLGNELLAKRNRVAHGESVFVRLDELSSFREKTMTGLSEFKYDILTLAFSAAHLC